MSPRPTKTIITCDYFFADYDTNKLFWVDAFDHLGASDLDGQGRTSFLHDSLRAPFGVVTYGDDVYWIQRKEPASVERTNKNTPGRVETVVTTAETPAGLLVPASLSLLHVHPRRENLGEMLT